MIQPWQKLRSRPLGDFRIFAVRCDEKISPRTQQPHEFFVLESPDWVNIVALTPDHHVVMVEQYRHGTDTVELEIPGGLLDGEESPVAAGLRELREETGYEGAKAEIICEMLPNPAFMSNRVFTVVVRDCELKHPVEWDHSEDIITRLVPVTEIPGLIARGRIRHTIIVAALSYFDLWQRNQVAQDRL